MNAEFKQKRLLCIVGSMNAGGAETFLMKVYRALDKEKYQMDFFVSIKEEGIYDKEIISMGGKIYHSIPKSKSFLKSFIAIKETVKREKYECVMRISQHSISSFDLLAAKRGGAKTLIFRSSNSGMSDGGVVQILHIMFKWLSMTIPNVRIAPSTEAAEYVFGKNCINNGNAIIVKNAIALENFMFNVDCRKKIRNEFDIDGKIVVGHVGRFTKQKNHSFLLDVFEEIVKKRNNCVLLLVGKGELENDIKNKIEKLNLKDKVIFTGIRADISDIMMAMDIFVFPSYFEGMPNVVIEAQATGLQCVVSDSITKEAQITDYVCYKSLKATPKEWAEIVIDKFEPINRNNMAEYFIDNGYDIRLLVKKFEKIIFAQ